MYENSKIDKVLFEDLDCIGFDVKPENDEAVKKTSATKSCDEQNISANEKDNINCENPQSKENEVSLENATATIELNTQNPKKKKNKQKVKKKSVQDTPDNSGKDERVAKSTTTGINSKTDDNDTKEFEDLKMCLELASKEYQITHTVAALSKSTVKITACNGDVVNIPIVNFQGFFVAERNYSCTLCQIIVKIDDKRHAWTHEHMTKTMTSIEDKHCLRKVSDSCTHCILCNSLHQSTKQNEHIRTTCHLANLKKYSADVFNNARAVLGEETISVCNSNGALSKGSLINFLTKHNLELTDNAAIFCKSCQIQIKNDKKVVIQHAYSTNHRQNDISSVITANELVLLKNGQYRCNPCGKDLYPHYLKTHCSYKQHKKKIKIEINRAT